MEINSCVTDEVSSSSPPHWLRFGLSIVIGSASNPINPICLVCCCGFPILPPPPPPGRWFLKLRIFTGWAGPRLRRLAVALRAPPVRSAHLGDDAGGSRSAAQQEMKTTLRAKIKEPPKIRNYVSRNKFTSKKFSTKKILYCAHCDIFSLNFFIL